MNTILVTSVGGSSAPVVNAIRGNAPLEFAIFLCSKESQVVVEGPATDRLGKSIPSVVEVSGLDAGSYEIEVVESPDDLQSVVEACTRIGGRVAASHPGSRSVVANYTGGTKTMSAGLVLYAALQPDWQIQAQVGPRADTVAVRSGDVSQAQSVAFVHGERARYNARLLAERHDYAGAEALVRGAIRNLRPGSALSQALHSDRSRYGFHEALDRFDYAEARRLLEAELPKDAPERERRQPLGRCLQALEALRGNGPLHQDGLELVADLVQNAERCAFRRRYDDAVGRLYRATELLAQLRLRRAYGLLTGALDLEALRAKLGGADHEILARLAERPTPSKIGLSDAYEVLGALGDPLGAVWAETGSCVREWLAARNQSWFAHGFTAVSEPAWNKSGQPWADWIRAQVKALSQ
jgi:CRISPR-associated protein (TIGR02710 family)